MAQRKPRTPLGKRPKQKSLGPNISTLQKALDSIPFQDSPRTRRAYEEAFGRDYHYETFLNEIIRAIKQYALEFGEEANCFSMLSMWSSNNITIEMWKDAEPSGQASYTMVKILGHALKLSWKHLAENNKPIASIGNTETLFDRYNIELCSNLGSHGSTYICGDPDVMEKFFAVKGSKPAMGKYYGPFSSKVSCALIMGMAESHGYHTSRGSLVAHLDSIATRRGRDINIMKEYIETDFNLLPQEYKVNEDNAHLSSFEALWDTIQLSRTKHTELYRSFYQKWWLSFIKNIILEPTEYDMNIGTLLFTGPEQIRKSSHFLCCLPTAFRSNVTSTTHGFRKPGDLRDVTKLAASSFIIFWDEFEQYLHNETEPGFKKLMDSTRQTFIDKYETSSSTVRPIAVYGATSNRDSFNLSSQTNRRLMHIPVKWLDTDAQKRLCWHPIMTELAEKARVRGSWLLTPEELQVQAKLHGSLIVKNSVDLILGEIWDFSSRFDRLGSYAGVQEMIRMGRLMTIGKVAKRVRKAGRITPTAAELYKSLVKMCSHYTETNRGYKRIDTKRSKGSAAKLQIRVKSGIVEFENSMFFVMPKVKK